MGKYNYDVHDMIEAKNQCRCTNKKAGLTFKPFKLVVLQCSLPET